MGKLYRAAKETAIGINQTKFSTQELNEIALKLKLMVEPPSSSIPVLPKMKLS